MGDEGEAAAVMVPVASTVIPLDDLPEYKVGIGFGLNEKEKVRVPYAVERVQCTNRIGTIFAMATTNGAFDSS